MDVDHQAAMICRTSRLEANHLPSLCFDLNRIFRIDRDSKRVGDWTAVHFDTDPANMPWTSESAGQFGVTGCPDARFVLDPFDLMQSVTLNGNDLMLSAPISGRIVHSRSRHGMRVLRARSVLDIRANSTSNRKGHIPAFDLLVVERNK